jgi:hypothetical protein
MNFISISDDDLNFKASKWLLEELLNLGCNSFSFLLKSVECSGAPESQKSLCTELRSFKEGMFELETFFYSQNSNPWFSVLEKYQFNRDSMAIILNHMGRNLLDWNVNLNKGISNWQFYADSKLIGGANVDDDCFTILSPTEGFALKLEQMQIPHMVKAT